MLTIEEILQNLRTTKTKFLNEEIRNFIKNTNFIFEHKQEYFRLVRILTEEVYLENLLELNPKNLKRGWKKGYQLDHKFSVSEGFKQKICPFILSSKWNLELLKKRENKLKSGKCSINLEELYKNFYKENERISI